MLYYDYKVTVKNHFDKIDSNEAFNGKINSNVTILNEKQKYNVRFFVNRIQDNIISLCGVIGYKNNDDPKELAGMFVTNLGFVVESVEGGETTIKSFSNLIRRAERNGFIDDTDSILEMSAPGNYRLSTSSTYDEELNIFIDLDDEELIRKAESVNCLSLNDEVKRILAMPVKQFIGHPVHYILRVDSSELMKDIVDILTAALYKAHRIKSRRVSIMEAKPQSCGLPWEEETIMTLNVEVLKGLYKAVPGGTIVINPGKIDYETETVNSGMATIDDLATLINENRKDCLSIVVFPRINAQSAAKFKSALNKIRFVEISEEAINQDVARSVLEAKASKDGITDTTSLIARIPADEAKVYYESDIVKIYSDWKEERLCTEIFPLYKDIRLVERAPEENIGDAYDKLQNLIGLKNVKQVVNEALDFCNYQKMFFDRGLTDLQPSRHMVFTGNPGTAKTTVARLFAQIMKDNKVLPRGKLVEVGRKDLVGKYVGWTAKNVERAFIDARGSVLFIDEAYSLCDDRDGMFGDEAINTIVQMMENQRDDTIVIFAGYPDKMKAFLDKNPGLRSRIAFHVSFDDYKENELMEILNLMAHDDKMEFDHSVESKVREILSQAINEKDFGNGRFVRNIYERARMRQASRLVRMKSNEIDNATLKTLIADDFIMPDELANKTTYRSIGFAS